VLAVARQRGGTLASTQGDLVFLGLAGMIDPPRPEARDSVASCRRASIRPVMITGDHPATAAAVAREIGIVGDGGVVVGGADVDRLSGVDLARVVGSVSVFARTSPAQKLRVVQALQADGEVVAMTGDGVNDAPALKTADVGVAMGLTGTDVSKEAADMTLLDDNFASIVAAVEEGRGIYSNIRKYLMYLLSSNVGEMGLMLAASLAGLPLPLNAVQILYVNLATDGLPALALAVDPPDPDLMRRPPRNPRSGIFTTPVVMLMLLGGLWSAAVNIGIFIWALGSDRGLPHAMTMTFVSLVMIQFFKAYSFRSERQPLLRLPFANRWLNRAVAWELAVLAAVLSLPDLRHAFGLVPLAPGDWVAVVVAAGSVLPALEIGKACIRHRWPEVRVQPA
jgi:Ca2+-transporting ATPase